MSATINFRLDDDLKEELVIISEETGVKISVLLRNIIEDYLFERFVHSSKNNENKNISDDDKQYSFNVEIVY